jgi:hypothetical protein
MEGGGGQAPWEGPMRAKNCIGINNELLSLNENRKGYSSIDPNLSLQLLNSNTLDCTLRK